MPMKQYDSSVSFAQPRPRRKSVPKYLSQQEIASFFGVIEDLRDRALFRVIYHRGLRAHEPARLQLSDFREREGRLRVTRGKGSAPGEYRLCDEELRSAPICGTGAEIRRDHYSLRGKDGRSRGSRSGGSCAATACSPVSGWTRRTRTP